MFWNITFIFIHFNVILWQTYWKMILMMRRLTQKAIKSNLLWKSIKPRLNTIGTEILRKVRLPPNTEAILKRRPIEIMIMNITKHKTVNTDNKTTVTNISESFQVWIFNYWYWLIDQKNNSWKKIIENSSALPVKKYCTKQSIFWGSSFISLRIHYWAYVVLNCDFEKVSLPVSNLHLCSFNKLFWY